MWLQQFLLDVARGDALGGIVEDFPDQADLIEDVALVLAAIAIVPLLWMVWLVIAGAFDLVSTIERQGVVVRARRPQRVVPFPRLLRPLARRDRFSLFIAVDDGRSDRVAPGCPTSARPCPRAPRARVKATPVLGYVRRSEPIGTTRSSTRILLTNDDGIDSIGLHVLAREMRRHGDVVVVAPDSEHSGAGAALGPLHLMRPELRSVHLDGIGEAWAVNGPPGLCVMFARLGLFGPVDFVVSGINPGANVGRAVYHSGTVGAVLTGRNGGLSGVAVSQAVAGFGVEGQGWDEMISDQHWEVAATVGGEVAKAILDAGLATPIVANVNVPNLPLAEIAGWRRTEVGSLPPRAVATARLDPVAGRDGVFAVHMEWGDAVELPPESDGGAIERNEVAVSFLSRLVDEERDDIDLAPALDGLLARQAPTLRA